MEKRFPLFLTLLFLLSLTFLLTTTFAENLKPGELPPELLEKIAASSGDDPYVIMLPTQELLDFDPTQGETGKITYSLSKPARIRIRIGISENGESVLRTLIDWEERAAGENEELWDGTDSAGHILDPKQCSIRFNIKTDHTFPEEFTDPAVLPEESKKGPPPRYRHEKHNQEKCVELKIEIISPKEGSTISGLTKVMVKLEEPSGYSDKVGNGLRVYLDYQPEEIKESFHKGSRVFTWKWDTTTIPNGSHILTINLCDHNDHDGVDSVKVNIEN